MSMKWDRIREFYLNRNPRYELENPYSQIVITVDHYEGTQPDGWPDRRYRVAARTASGKSLDRTRTFRGEMAWSDMDALVSDLLWKWQRAGFDRVPSADYS